MAGLSEDMDEQSHPLFYRNVVNYPHIKLNPDAIYLMSESKSGPWKLKKKLEMHIQLVHMHLFLNSQNFLSVHF